MINKGRIKYVPRIALIEIDDIKREDGISMDCEAFRKLVQYARVGRETSRITNFTYNWKNKATLPPIDKPKKIKIKRRKSLFDFKM